MALFALLADTQKQLEQRRQELIGRCERVTETAKKQRPSTSALRFDLEIAKRAAEKVDSLVRIVGVLSTGSEPEQQLNEVAELMSEGKVLPKDGAYIVRRLAEAITDTSSESDENEDSPSIEPTPLFDP